jgi:serine/threonine protein kinase
LPNETGLDSIETVSRSCPKCNKTYPDKVAFCGYDGTITIQVQDPADFDERLGEQLGGYVVVARVADGAMGRVYEGRHPETKERVAIKVLHSDTVKDQVAIERFKREYETATEMQHPQIIKVLEFGGTPDGSYFMTMEYLEGEELRKLLDREGVQPMDRVIRVVSQVAMALDYAHSFGFIHRDLKPDNIFLCRTAEGDVVRILDFGSVKLQVETGAKLTALGTTLGSPYYMSPEQAQGALDVDQRSDVFALSAILYEMLTGKVAFGAANVAQILVKIMTESPPPASSHNPTVPQSVDDVIDKGLRKDKERRYATTVQFADALAAAFGLGDSGAAWANRPQSEIAAALEQAVPKPPKPLGVESVPPQPESAESEPISETVSSQVHVSPPRIDSMVDEVPAYITRPGRKGASSVVNFLLILLAIGGLVVIGGLISYLLR